MGQHVIQAQFQNGSRDLLVAGVSLCFRQVGFEVTIHQQRRPIGALAGGFNDALYRQGVVRGEVTPHE